MLIVKRTAVAAAALVLGFVLLFVVANRPLRELLGYARAGASTTVKSIEEELPDAVHDEKTAAELQAARQQLVDRQVQLNLSQNQLQDLQREVAGLKQAIAQRREVLASAYPVLQQALDGKQQKIVFVNTNFSLAEFQHEIDDLLAMQERDENALRVKQQGHERLSESVRDGELALADMKGRLLEIEQEFAVLKARRDQARMESETLDLVAGATSDHSTVAADVGQSVERLESQVEKLEARNSARRELAPVEQRASKSRLAQSFNRLEALRKYAQATPANADDAIASGRGEANQSASSDVDSTSDRSETIPAREVVIKIQGQRTPNPSRASGDADETQADE